MSRFLLLLCKAVVGENPPPEKLFLQTEDGISQIITEDGFLIITE